MKFEENEVLPSRANPMRVTAKEGKDFFNFLELTEEKRQFEVCEFEEPSWEDEDLPDFLVYLGESSASQFLYENWELEKVFRQLVDKWDEETQFFSDLKEVVLHSAYQGMIGLGPQVIPLILREMQERPSEWFWALRAVSRENPAELCRGTQQITVAWLEWGKQKGYI